MSGVKVLVVCASASMVGIIFVICSKVLLFKASIMS